MNHDNGLFVLEQMKFLSRSERKIQAQWLQQLAIVDTRRLFALAGFNSLFAYLNHGLNYSEGTAAKRIQVSRTAQAFPAIYDLLKEGEFSMTSISRLSPHLTEENHLGVLRAARGMNVRQVEEYVASLVPKPDVPDSHRKVAGTGNQQKEMAVAPAETTKPSEANPPKRKEKIEPLGEARFHMNFTISQETSALQKRLTAVTGHGQSPSMEEVYRAGLQALLKKHDPKEKLATVRTLSVPAAPKPSKNAKYISRRMRRAVFMRDGHRCVYVSPDGRRCTAEDHLEIDHIIPSAKGGNSKDLENLRTLCSTHNKFAARQTFGDAFIDRKVREATVLTPWT